MPPDFADDLLREALRCYSGENFTTTCVACRVAVEEELKEIYELLNNLGDHSTWQHVEEMHLESLKAWAKALRIINGAQMHAIERVQGRGNRSAHGPTADMRRQLRNRRPENFTQPLEIWADRQAARRQLQATASILQRLKRKKERIQREQRIP